MPLLDADELQALDYKSAIYPNTPLRVTMAATREVLDRLHADGTSRAVLDRLLSRQERRRLVGLSAPVRRGVEGWR